MTIDLTPWRLAKPVVVRELDYEALLAARKAQFTALWEALRIEKPELPSIDALAGEFDPGTTMLQAAAVGDLLFVAELNDTARVVRLVDFADGADLDLHGAEFSDTAFVRLAGELDAAWRARIKTRRRGSSAAGPDDWYAWHALAVSPRVAEISIDERVGGLVRIAVRSADNGGVPDAALLDQVRMKLTSRAVRPRGMRVEVAAAEPLTVDVTAHLTLLPDALDEIVASARTNLAAAWSEEAQLGRDLTVDWIKSQLMLPGVHSVALDTPDVDRPAAAHQVVVLGTVSVSLAGRSW